MFACGYGFSQQCSTIHPLSSRRSHPDTHTDVLLVVHPFPLLSTVERTDYGRHRTEYSVKYGDSTRCVFTRWVRACGWRVALHTHGLVRRSFHQRDDGYIRSQYWVFLRAPSSYRTSMRSGPGWASARRPAVRSLLAPMASCRYYICVVLERRATSGRRWTTSVRCRRGMLPTILRVMRNANPCRSCSPHDGGGGRARAAAAAVTPTAAVHCCRS